MPIPVKKGKMYMKDGSGNFIQIVPEATFATPEYVGATASSAGVSGMVPAALSSQKDKYLKGDGTWAELVLPDEYQGATDSESGIAGLVPSALAEEKDMFLRGDGEWAAVDVSSAVHIEGEETVTGAKIFSQGPFSNVVRASANGTYNVNASSGQIFVLSIERNTTLSFSGVPAGRGTSLKIYADNKGAYSLTWPNNVIWNTNPVPSLSANKMDVFELSTMDGGKSWYASRILASIDKWTGDTMYINGKTGCSIKVNCSSTAASGSSDKDPEIDIQWIDTSTDIHANVDYTFSNVFSSIEPTTELSYDIYGLSAEINYEDEEGNHWMLTIVSSDMPGCENSDYSEIDGAPSIDDYGLENTIFWNMIDFSSTLYDPEVGDSDTFWFNCKKDENGNISYYSGHDVSLTITYIGNGSYTVTIRWTK